MYRITLQRLHTHTHTYSHTHIHTHTHTHTHTHITKETDELLELMIIPESAKIIMTSLHYRLARAHERLPTSFISSTYCMRSTSRTSGSSTGYPVMGPSSATPLANDMLPPSVASFMLDDAPSWLPRSNTSCFSLLLNQSCRD